MKNIILSLDKTTFEKEFPGIQPEKMGLDTDSNEVFAIIFDENNGLESVCQPEYENQLDRFLNVCQRKERYVEDD
jgi:hypothetical protein